MHSLKKSTEAGPPAINCSTAERVLLRDLAQQVAEIAALPAQQQTIDDWKALNALQPNRPMD
ncbi:MAG: hypothetical protein QGF67_15705 [Lentisphaeria bacterium]|jgi:hypothetical protein|nr:hypothetical protein [Lentisphaeria bacterium]MDP7742885.1 hypothetical protein [Lentisphaeria bacterium]